MNVLEDVFIWSLLPPWGRRAVIGAFIGGATGFAVPILVETVETKVTGSSIDGRDMFGTLLSMGVGVPLGALSGAVAAGYGTYYPWSSIAVPAAVTGVAKIIF